MKDRNWVTSLIVFVVLFFVALSAQSADFYISAPASVYFSPSGGAQDALVQKVDGAKKDVYVASYTFSSKPIADALIRAAARGVKVQVVVDNSNWTQTYTQIHNLRTNGVSVYVDSVHAIMHDKYMLIDGIILITGSFNFTASAESRNAENLIMLRTTQGYALYQSDWSKHQMHSVPSYSYGIVQ